MHRFLGKQPAPQDQDQDLPSLPPTTTADHDSLPIPPSSSTGIFSSSQPFATPVHPLKPFQPPAPAQKHAVLPILLPPATLRPLAFRTFTKKHSLTLTSAALQELATFIGRHCGSGWREEGLAEKVLEEVAKSWKSRNGGVIVDGTSKEWKDLLKTLEGNIVGGRISNGSNNKSNSRSNNSSGSGSVTSGAMSGNRSSLSRSDSLRLDAVTPSQEADLNNTRLGIRPASVFNRSRNDSSSHYDSSHAQNEDSTDGGNLDDESLYDVRKWIKVIPASEQPRLLYNVHKKHFEREQAKATLMPEASLKTQQFRNRFHVLHQRLMRNEAFQTSAVALARGPLSRSSSLAAGKGASGSGSTEGHRITSIVNLLGRHGSHHMLLGMLTLLPTGEVALCDLTGTIALNIAQTVAIPEDSAWFAPGMIVLVDGVYEEEEESVGRGLGGNSGVGGILGGKFQAFFMGQPPSERRRVTLAVSGMEEAGGGQGGRDGASASASMGGIGGGFGWIDFLGVGSERAVGSKMRTIEQRLFRHMDSQTASQRCRIVLLGEIHLDDPRALQALRKILALYHAEPESSLPMTFVLTGNFTSGPVMARGGTSGGSVEYKEYFDGLAAVLDEFPALLEHCTFVFVPGDHDGWVSSFTAGASVPIPRGPVPDMFLSRIRRLFASVQQRQERAAAAQSGKEEKDRPRGPSVATTGGSTTVAAAKAEVIATSNPARLSVFGPSYEVVVFRDDFTARLERNSIRLRSQRDEEEAEKEAKAKRAPASTGTKNPTADDSMEVDPEQAPTTNPRNAHSIEPSVLAARKLVKTILDQAHLAPFRPAIRPVHWSYAPVLQLYPLPSALLLVDATTVPFCVTYEGCHVVNPGSLLIPEKKNRARWAEYELGRVGQLREIAY